jgi:hypothetical protein
MADGTTKKLSITDFAKQIKSKYPDYSDLDDDDLVERIVRKNPVYADQVDLPQGFSLLHTTSGYPNLDKIYEDAGKANNVDPNLLLEQGRKETRFKPDVMYGRKASPAGAKGSGQFISDTAKRYNVDVNDPISGINGQARYMRDLLDKFNGDEKLALAGYNAGENRTSLEQGRVPNIPETQDYVKEISDKLGKSRSDSRGTLKSLLSQLQQPSQPEVTPPTLSADTSLPTTDLTQQPDVVQAVHEAASALQTPAGRILANTAIDQVATQSAIGENQALQQMPQTQALAGNVVSPSQTPAASPETQLNQEESRINQPSTAYQESDFDDYLKKNSLPKTDETRKSFEAGLTAKVQQETQPQNQAEIQAAADLQKAGLPDTPENRQIAIQNAQQTSNESTQPQNRVNESTAGATRLPTQFKEGDRPLTDEQLMKTGVDYQVNLQGVKGDKTKYALQSVADNISKQYGIPPDQAQQVVKEGLEQGSIRPDAQDATITVPRGLLAKYVGADKIKQEYNTETSNLQTDPGYLAKLEEYGRAARQQNPESTLPEIKGFEQMTPEERSLAEGVGGVADAFISGLQKDITGATPTWDEKVIRENERTRMAELQPGTLDFLKGMANLMIVQQGLLSGGGKLTLGGGGVNPNFAAGQITQLADVPDAVAGGARALADLGIISDQTYSTLRKGGSVMRELSNNLSDNTTLGKVLKAAGQLSIAVPEFTAMTPSAIAELPGGTMAIFALHGGLTAAGRGETAGQIAGSAGRGGAVGFLLPASSALEKSAADFIGPAAEGYKGADLIQKVFGLSAKVGSVAVGTGSAYAATGASKGETAQAMIEMALLSLVPHGKDPVSYLDGRIYRFGTSDGQSLDFTVDSSGNIRLAGTKSPVSDKVVDVDIGTSNTKLLDDIVQNNKVKETLGPSLNEEVTPQQREEGYRLVEDLLNGKKGAKEKAPLPEEPSGGPESPQGEGPQSPPPIKGPGENLSKDLEEPSEITRTEQEGEHQVLVKEKIENKGAGEEPPAEEAPKAQEEEAPSENRVEPKFETPAPVRENRPYSFKDMESEIKQAFPSTVAEKPAINVAQQQEKGGAVEKLPFSPPLESGVEPKVENEPSIPKSKSKPLIPETSIKGADLIKPVAVTNYVPAMDEDKYRSDQQIRLNAGAGYKPVRIIAHPDLINLIKQGPKLGSGSANYSPEMRELESSFGIHAPDAAAWVRQIVKANRSPKSERMVFLSAPDRVLSKVSGPLASVTKGEDIEGGDEFLDYKSTFEKPIKALFDREDHMTALYEDGTRKDIPMQEWKDMVASGQAKKLEEGKRFQDAIYDDQRKQAEGKIIEDYLDVIRNPSSRDLESFHDKEGIAEHHAEYFADQLSEYDPRVTDDDLAEFEKKLLGLGRKAALIGNEEWPEFLEKVATPEARESHLAQKNKTTPQLLLNLDFKNTPQGLEINSPTMEFTRRMIEASKGKSFPVSDAMFHNPQMAKMIGHTVQQFTDKFGNSLPPSIAKQLKKYSRALTGTAKGGKIIYTFDEAVRHEKLHKLSYTSAGVKRLTQRVKDLASFAKKNKRLVDHAYQHHYSQYGYDLPDLNKDNFSPAEMGQIAVIVEEMAVSIMDGDIKTLGLTPAQSAEYIDNWLIAYRDQHGIQSLRNFEKFFSSLGEFTPALQAIRSINERTTKTKVKEGNKNIPPAPKRQPGEEAEGARRNNRAERERATIRSAEEANLVDHMDDRYYTVKHKDANARQAQDRIEQIGLAQSLLEAVLPAPAGQRAEHTAFQMEVVHLLNRQANRAVEAGNKDMASAKLAAAQVVVAEIAEAGTDYGQAISQLSEWQKDGDPEAVTGYIQKRRAQFGYAEPLTPEQQDLVRKQAEELANLRDTVGELQKQIENIDRRLKGGPRNPRTVPKTNPHIERLQKMRDEIRKRFEDNPLMQVAWHGSRERFENQAFYSAVEKTLEQKMPNKASADQVRGILKSPGIKQEELGWLGIDPWLNEHLNPTKDEVLQFVQGNNVQLEVKHFTGTSDKRLTRYRSREGQTLADELENSVKKFLREWGNEKAKDRLDIIAGEVSGRALEDDDPLDIIDSAIVSYTRKDVLVPGEVDKEVREALNIIYGKVDDFQSFIGSGISEDEDVKYGDEDYRLPGPIDDYREILIKLPDQVQFKKQNYRGPHFANEANILGWARVTSRKDSKGKNVLVIEEIQSDWHQQGRKRGYEIKELPKGYEVSPREGAFAVTDEKGLLVTTPEWSGYGRTKEEATRLAIRALNFHQRTVPNAPFKKSWHELVFKQMLHYAAENNFDKVAWTTGDQQNDRWSLDKHVKKIDWEPGFRGEDTSVSLYLDRNRLSGDDVALIVDNQGVVAGAATTHGVGEQLIGQSLSDVIGKELADKILSKKKGTLSGLDLRVGGEGMRGFYDKMIPTFVNKYVKQWGAKVGETSVKGPGDGRRYAVNVGGDTVGYFETREEAEEGAETRQEKYGEDASVVIMPHEQSLHSVDITSEMKEGVLTEGQPLFSVSKPRDIGLKTLYNKNGDINYEEIQAIAEKVVSGVYKISRLTHEGENGRIRGGQRLLEASILLGAAEEASPTGVAAEEEDRYRIINRGYASRKKIITPQEKILEKYAKHEGLWVEPDNPILSPKLFIASGLESYVYRDASDPNFVIKNAMYGNATPMTPQQFLDKIAVFNALFPDTTLELIGMSQKDEYFSFILRQRYIKGQGLGTDKEDFKKFNNFISDKYDAYPVNPPQPVYGVPDTDFENDRYSITDLHEGNVLKTPDGQFHVIDAEVHILPALNSYTPLKITSTRPEGVAEEDQPLFKLTPDQQKDLTDYTALNILDGVSLEDTMDDLRKIAPNLTSEERAEIHLKAWDMVYPHKTEATKTERATIRLEHFREIQKTRSRLRQGVKKEINPEFKKANPKQGPKKKEGIIEPGRPSASSLRLAEVADDEGLDPKELHAAIMLENGEVRDANEAAAYLREYYPELSAGDALNLASMGAKFRQKAKKQIAAENEELKKQKEKAERKLSQETKKKNVAQRELLNRIKSLEKPPPTYSMRIGRIYKAALVSAVQTSVNNFITAQGARKIVTLTDLTELAINKALSKAGREIRPEGIQPNTPIRDILGLSTDTDGAVDTLKKNFTEAVFAQSMADSVLDEFPTFYEELFRSYASDIAVLPEKTGPAGAAERLMRGVEFTYDKLNTLNKFQEFLLRSQEFNRQLQIRLGGKGLTLKGVIESGRLNQIDPNDIKYAVREALRVTFALSPDRNTLFGRFIDLYESKIPSLLAPFLITFPRFTYNAGGFIADYTPIIGIIKAAGRGGNGDGNQGGGGGFGGGRGSYWEGFKNINSRDVSRQLIGVLIFLTALMFVRAFGDDDKWYLLQVPGATKNGKPLYVDVRGWQPFAAFVYLANKVNRLISGKPMFSDPDSAFPDTIEALLGLSTRNLTDNKILQSLWSGGKAVTGLGDDKEWERISYLMQQQLGEIVGGFLRPLKTIRDLVAQFDDYQNQRPDMVDHPVLNGVTRSVPFANSLTGADIVRDYVTGKPEEDMAPGLKVFGVSLVDGERHREVPSPALVKIRELEEEYRPSDILPEAQKSRRLKGDFWEAIRKAGNDIEQQKLITERLEDAKKEGKLTEGQADYIERGKGLTELQSHIKSAKWDHVIQTIQVMSDAEKNEVRPIIQKRLDNSRTPPTDVEEQKLEDLGFTRSEGLRKLKGLPRTKGMKSAFEK